MWRSCCAGAQPHSYRGQFIAERLQDEDERDTAESAVRIRGHNREDRQIGRTSRVLAPQSHLPGEFLRVVLLVKNGFGFGVARQIRIPSGAPFVGAWILAAQ
jgi:hypothetical protein